jgi:DNA polymerase-1
VYNLYKHQETERAYKEILQPSLKPLIKMMVTGLPIDMDRVDIADKAITEELDKANKVIKSSSFVAEAEENLRYFAAEKYNATHVGNKEPWQFEVEFNPNSAVQLRVLLFDVMGFEPIELTEGGSPKTDRASIKEFLSECPEDDARIGTLKALVSISETAIIQNTFISAFKEMSLDDGHGNFTLHGNLRLGGTQSGRLSSSEPNL